MWTPPRLRLRAYDHGNVVVPYIKSYEEYLEAGRHKPKYRRRCIASAIHFGQWLSAEGRTHEHINEAVVGLFLSEHLPRCDCPRPVPLELNTNRAALNQLIRIVCSLSGIAREADDELTRELARFDEKMAEVWGLSTGTRYSRRRIIRRLLIAQFGPGPIDVGSISPSAVRGFVLGDAISSASAIRGRGDAVRCYLRYRELLGDRVTDLRSAVPRPASWRQAALPDTLTADEVQQLLRSFDVVCPSRRRGYAIVRCLVDLGLRCSEVANLRLDDIDRHEGTVRLAAGKTRRTDVLPLPAATGAAIADYLREERPNTSCRSIFVRHVAPLGKPVGRRVVQRTVRAAYLRCGWDRTRAHILRHTMATRLLNAGTPMKQIADILRHRNLATSAIYTKVDHPRLAAVALSWPGSAS
ncbi:MAG: tyrosine-type recombinase/integrase [Candidatus Eremiobacteraeota bacterium]|nr:tyrosine-type recombinase/integrase [Candidatus Eremiobacteraeota bacterium]